MGESNTRPMMITKTLHELKEDLRRYGGEYYPDSLLYRPDYPFLKRGDWKIQARVDGGVTYLYLNGETI